MGHLNLVLELPKVVRRNASLAVAHSLIRSHPTDRYIVSYPRSGSTWLRTILAGIMDPNAGFEPEVFNRMLPGVSGRRLPLVWKLRHPRLMHSHTNFRRGVRKAVYLVRDGRDSLVSFYHYTTTRNGLNIPFKTWFDLYCLRWYGPRWHDNVESWLIGGRGKLGDRLLVVKFEDLKADPVGHVREIADFLGLPSRLDLVSRAVEMARIERAREREARVVGPLDDSNKSFYRGGRTGQYQDYLVDSMYDRFMSMSSRALSLAGYDK